MRLLFPILVLAVTITSSSTAYVPDTLTVTFFDVSQVDSTTVSTPNGHAMLIDTGEPGDASTVMTSLPAEGVSQLDYVVATHDHDDHIGGMIDVLPRVTVEEP